MFLGFGDVKPEDIDSDLCVESRYLVFFLLAVTSAGIRWCATYSIRSICEQSSIFFFCALVYFGGIICSPKAIKCFHSLSEGLFYIYLSTHIRNSARTLLISIPKALQSRTQTLGSFPRAWSR